MDVVPVLAKNQMMIMMILSRHIIVEQMLGFIFSAFFECWNSNLHINQSAII